MNLNWSTMKKEQKQALMLGLMWLVGGLFALYQFVLMPFFRDSGDDAGELEQLQTQILKAQVAMDSEGKVSAEFGEMTDVVRASANTYIVPMDNSLTWATEKIYEYARLAGVDIQSVSEMPAKSAGWEKLAAGERAFKPYVVRIVAESSYPELLSLLGALELDNPFVTVTSIALSAQDQNPVRHMVHLVVEWPIWGREIKFKLAKLQGDAAEEAN